jgi:prepilin-type processing-associated H-X9-DG protein
MGRAGEVKRGFSGFLGNSVQYARHGNSKPTLAGGSNYLFTDGSARYIKFGGDVNPVCMWAVSMDSRNEYALPLSALTPPGLQNG